MHKILLLFIVLFVSCKNTLSAQWSWSIWHNITNHEGIATLEDDEPSLSLIDLGASYGTVFDYYGGIGFWPDASATTPIYRPVQYLVEFLGDDQRLSFAEDLFRFDMPLEEISSTGPRAPFTIGRGSRLLAFDRNEIQSFLNSSYTFLGLNNRGGGIGIGRNELNIDSDGRIGIGTDNPYAYKMHIAGSNLALLLDSEAPILCFGKAGKTDGLIKHENQDIFFFNGENGNSQFGAIGTGLMHLDEDGSLGIGALPLSPLHVEHDALELVRLENTTTDYASIDLYYAGERKAQIVNTENTMFYINNEEGSTFFGNKGENQIVLNQDGYLGIVNTSPAFELDVAGDGNFTGELTAASDIKLKREITGIDHATERIMDLNPVQYYFRSDEYPELQLSTQNRYGLIAQEVEALIPELVNNDAQFTTETVEQESYKTLNYIDLIPILIRGLQEQEEEIVALNKLINKKLENQISNGK